MAVCKYCNRAGLFFQVNKSGLCSSCTPGIIMEVQSRLKVINESVKLVENSTNLEVRLGRCDTIVENAQALMKFENKGIEVIHPLPSQYIKLYSSEKYKIIDIGFADEVRRAIEKSNIGTTLSSKISPLTKSAMRINDYQQKYPENKNLKVLLFGVKETINKIQLQSFLKNAELAELKGNKKKALDQFYEALYFLRTDEIDDSLQSDFISFVEDKIKELSKVGNKILDL